MSRTPTLGVAGLTKGRESAAPAVAALHAEIEGLLKVLGGFVADAVPDAQKATWADVGELRRVASALEAAALPFALAVVGTRSESDAVALVRRRGAEAAATKPARVPRPCFTCPAIVAASDAGVLCRACKAKEAAKPTKKKTKGGV